MAEFAAPERVAARARPAPISLGAGAWALYEWARNPYVIVCGIYIFTPYVASAVIGDPVEGQAQIANLNAWAGLATALVAPILGAWADQAGGRKAPLGVLTAAMAAMIAALWAVTPGGPTLWFPMLLGVALLFPLTEALHNSMLATATTPQTLARVSGLGLALGNLGGLAILLFVLVFLALPGQVDWPFVPATPAFGLDRAAYEPERAVALICAGWYALFSLPLFLFTNDTPAREGWGPALVGAVRRVLITLRGLRDLGEPGRFLLARMFYADATTAILILGGIYVAGVMGWGILEMTLYGVILSVLAVFGGFLAGHMDQALGAKRAVQIEIAVCAFGLLGAVSIDRDTVLFAIEVGTAAVWPSPVFAAPAELAVMGFVSLIALSVTASYASSRTLMSQIAPPERAGELFGLYALAGTATVWAGPLLVGTVTALTQSQQVGFGSLLVLLGAGFWILRRVRAP